MIRDAASAGHDTPPTKETSSVYRDALTRIWILDEVPAWIPSNNRLRELGQAPKHQLADPALAARLLGVDAAALLSGRAAGPPLPRDGTLLGALFESLVTLSVRVYAQGSEARAGHLRTARGRHEIDLIVERTDGRVVAIEVKLARTVADRDVKNLKWLDEQLGDRLLDSSSSTPAPLRTGAPMGSPWRRWRYLVPDEYRAQPVIDRPRRQPQYPVPTPGKLGDLEVAWSQLLLSDLGVGGVAGRVRSRS